MIAEGTQEVVTVVAVESPHRPQAGMEVEPESGVIRDERPGPPHHNVLDSNASSSSSSSRGPGNKRSFMSILELMKCPGFLLAFSHVIVMFFCVLPPWESHPISCFLSRNGHVFVLLNERITQYLTFSHVDVMFFVLFPWSSHPTSCFLSRNCLVFVLLPWNIHQTSWSYVSSLSILILFLWFFLLLAFFFLIFFRPELIVILSSFWLFFFSLFCSLFLSWLTWDLAN